MCEIGPTHYGTGNKTAPAVGVRNLCRDMNREAMPLSIELSLAMSHWNIIMTYKTKTSLWSIGIRTHLPSSPTPMKSKSLPQREKR